MRINSVMRQPARLLAAALLLLAGCASALGEDTYNGTELSIPSMQIGSGTYSNVVVTPLKILAVYGGQPNGSGDTYSPVNNQLTIPAVFYNGTTYTNVVITVRSLVSVGGVVGVDFYNSPELFIPSVQVLGGSSYNNVVITVNSIASNGGGMPASVQDQYNPSTKQLTITAIQYSGKIYTNAIVNLGTVVSVGGSPVGDSILHSFSSSSTDGVFPVGTLTLGTDGNFYGTTRAGGLYPGMHSQGLGTVFRITPAGVEDVLYAFNGCVAYYGCVVAGSLDGATPAGDVIQGNDGNFYGATSYGGAYGQGTVFRVTPAGVETVLYSFSGCTFHNASCGFAGSLDGAIPAAGLIQGADGNFYGTTSSGGAYNVGTVFRVTPAGVEKVLYSFSGCTTYGCGIAGSTDGANPVTGLLLGNNGNFYGATSGLGSGTVFEITPAGIETVIYSFGSDTLNVSNPNSLILASDGNFYGTAGGGAYFNSLGSGGTVFKLTPTGVGTLLHSFSGGGSVAGSADGAFPNSLIEGADGNFYGTTSAGGGYDEEIGTGAGGTIFKITPAGIESVLHAFSGDGGITGSTDGASPVGLIQVGAGNLYGTTQQGGASNIGTVFVLPNVIQ